mgnify:CR=1 FL=1
MNPVNDAPTLDDLADSNGQEDSDFVLELSGADVDGDALTFLASVDANGSVSVDGSTLTVSPAADYNGDIVVSVIASDGQASGSGSFTLNVSPVNDAPVITAIADQSADEDTTFVFDVTASDVDGDDLTYSATNGNATITVDGNTLTVVPESNYVGDSVITVIVSDGTDSSTSTFTLTFNPVNDAPVLDAIADGSTDEDTAFVISLSSSDVDGDDVTYSASASNGSATVDGGILTVLPATDLSLIHI